MNEQHLISVVESNPTAMQGTISAGQKRTRDERGGPATKKAHVSDTEGNFAKFSKSEKFF